MAMIKIGRGLHFDTDDLSDEEYSLYLEMNKIDESFGKDYLKKYNNSFQLEKVIKKYNDWKAKQNPYNPKGKIGKCDQCNQEKPLFYWYGNYKFCSRKCETLWSNYMSRLI